MFLNTKRIYNKRRRIFNSAAFLCAVLFFVWSLRVWGNALGWWEENTAKNSSTESAEKNIQTTSTIERFLDGVYVDPSMASGTLFAVMIDNAPDAGSPAGIENAPLVVEAPAEGGISRLLAFFLTGQTVDAIGPVRSARAYFIDFARMFDAFYLHVGGAPDALEKLKGQWWSIDEYSLGQYFWRSGKRSAPHNVFTSTEEIGRLSFKRKAPSKYAPTWFFIDGAKPEERGGGSKLEINFGVTDVKWQYNKYNNVYERFTYGAPNMTFDNNRITASNVVVVIMPIKVIDEVGRLELKTVGSGKSLFLANGRSIEGTWQKLTKTAPLRFFDKNGTEISMIRGTIWIEIVGDGVEWQNN